MLRVEQDAIQDSQVDTDMEARSAKTKELQDEYRAELTKLAPQIARLEAQRLELSNRRDKIIKFLDTIYEAFGDLK